MVRCVSYAASCNAKIHIIRHLPWSFEAEVGFVLDFYPVKAGVLYAEQAKVADET